MQLAGAVVHARSVQLISPALQLQMLQPSLESCAAPSASVRLP
jgi:hypothetical protein